MADANQPTKSYAVGARSSFAQPVGRITSQKQLRSKSLAEPVENLDMTEDNDQSEQMEQPRARPLNDGMSFEDRPRRAGSMSGSFAKRDLAIAIPIDDADNDKNPYWQTPIAEEDPVEI